MYGTTASLQSPQPKLMSWTRRLFIGEAVKIFLLWRNSWDQCLQWENLSTSVCHEFDKIWPLWMSDEKKSFVKIKS